MIETAHKNKIDFKVIYVDNRQINHSKNKATAKRLSKLGEENAETEISKIISQKSQGDSLENKGDPIPNEKEENKVAIHNVGVGITPRSSTQLSTSENEMTKTI